MAAAVATASTDEPAPAKKGPSLVIQIVVLLVMTLVAMGLGYVSVGFIKGDAPAEPAVAAAPGGVAGAHEEKADAGGHGEDKKDAEGEEGVPPVSALPNAVALAPIMVNLAAPVDTWIRCELTIVIDGPPDPAITEAVHQDLLGYIRTLKLHQIQGPSGFQHLRSDLDMRARTRSADKVTAVLIRALLFE